MRIFLLFIFPLAAFFPLQQGVDAQTNSCIKCHRELGNKSQSIVEAFAQDIHGQVGLSCNDCHGGNPNEEDMDLAKDKSFKGAPKRAQIPDFCASCHADFNFIRSYNPSLRVDQLTLYKQSEHGLLWKKGNDKVAVCSDCHGTHSIQPASHPKSWVFPWNIPNTCGRCHSDKEYMKGTRLSTREESDYRESVHARALYEKKDLSAPVCNDCHGNHGAAPPELTSVAHVCHQCHPSTGDLFSQSKHKKAFDELGLAECDACHGNHKILPPTDEMLGTGEKAVCIQCHEEGSKPFLVAAQLKEKILGLAKRIDSSQKVLQHAKNKGVEVSEAQFRLSEASTILIMTRNLIHGISLESIDEKIKEGDNVVSEVEAAGKAALKEARFRREGLVVVVFVLLLLAIAIYTKIRQIDKK